MKSDIYLVRHTPIYNPQKLCLGQSEIPLAENFTVDFDWIKDQLNLAANTVYISSPFRRCIKLADFLSENSFTQDLRLSDLNFGAWEMKEWVELPKAELTSWTDNFVTYRPPNGENFLDLQERAISFFEEQCERTNTPNIVVLTHAGFIRSLLSYVLEFPLEKIFNLQIDFSSISKISYDFENKVSNVSYINSHAANANMGPTIGS